MEVDFKYCPNCEEKQEEQEEKLKENKEEISQEPEVEIIDNSEKEDNIDNN